MLRVLWAEYFFDTENGLQKKKRLRITAVDNLLGSDPKKDPVKILGSGRIYEHLCDVREPKSTTAIVTPLEVFAVACFIRLN